MKKLFSLSLVLLVSGFLASKAFAYSGWINDLKSLFVANKAIIYCINPRTFNAKDTNKNGIIEEDKGEVSGNFVNATDRLDEIQRHGYNTILLMPITPVGKIKALGTAGSLYATSDFSAINPQLKDKNSKTSLEEELIAFVDECHSRKIRVMVDLPCCGAYDLYLSNPQLFKKDKNNNPIVPSDWTDVRLLDGGSEVSINSDVYAQYKSFIKMCVNLGIDGVRADVPSAKPCAFWKKLISETQKTDPQFLFLAEDSQTKRPALGEDILNVSCDKILDAGFDGIYGNYSNVKNWKTAQNLYAEVRSGLNFIRKNKGNKGIVGNFATHNDISPMLVNGPQYSKMILWLGATLPINTLAVDGFTTGDDYIYFWANKKAPKTYTDDEYYFVHRGQIDIFNFSRRPGGKMQEFAAECLMANRFKALAAPIIENGTFKTYMTSSQSVFAYSMTYDKTSIIVIGNLDFQRSQDAKIFIPGMSKDLPSIPIKIQNIPHLEKGKIVTTLAPGDIQVLTFSGL